MTFDQYMEAARFLRKYAMAVESNLYMHMTVNQAHAEIETAEKLAHSLEEAASLVNTISPVDLG